MHTEPSANGKPGASNAYISGIDGLRALAVLAVLAYHLQIPQAQGGLLGVTIFFVISGFLITRILVSEIENTGTVDLKNFWIRRIRRLLPAILTMVVTLIFVSAVVNRILFTKTCSDLLSAVFCYNNWWQIFNNVSYFENAGSPSPLTHCWSLAVEAQFYLVYPLLLLLLSKMKNRQKASVYTTAVLAVVSALLMAVLFDPAGDPSRVYYGTDTRAFSLLIGALLAMLTIYAEDYISLPAALREGIGFAAVAGLVCMIVLVNGYSSFLYRGGQVLASVLSAAVIYAVLDPKSYLGKGLGLPVLKWIGDRSYGIYLWHYPIILLISGGKKPVWWAVPVELALTLILAALSYRYIETPIRHGVIGKSIALVTSRPKTRRGRRRAVFVLKKMLRVSAVTAVIAIAAVLCIAFVPRESTLNNIDQLQKQADDAKKQADAAKQQAEEQPAGGSGDTEDKSTAELTDEELLSQLNLLLIGDSVSLGAADEFYEIFPNSICDAAVNRYTKESVDIYDSYVSDQGWAGDGVIFALGSNGPLYDALTTLREHMGEDLPLFVLTIRAPYTTWEGSNNEELRAYAESSENTYLIDWYAESEEHPEYFAEDETHLVPEGAEAFVRCIRETVLEVYREKE